MRRRVLVINGWFLLFVGFLMAGMTLVGRYTGNGVLKLLHEQPLGAIGMFEGFVLAGLFGIVFIRVSTTLAELRFWNLVACSVHLILGTANLVFWSDAFVPMGAEVPAGIVTVFHFGFVLSEGYVALRKSH